MNATTPAQNNAPTSAPNSFEDIILYAIEQEEVEYGFYQHLASLTTTADLKQMLLHHAQQEKEHVAKLQQVLSRHRLPNATRVQANPDLHIANYVVASPSDLTTLSYQDALILAIKMEQANENLYRDLANMSANDDSRTLFNFLVEQERKHRDLLEREYDDNILQQN